MFLSAGEVEPSLVAAGQSHADGAIDVCQSVPKFLCAAARIRTWSKVLSSAFPLAALSL